MIRWRALLDHLRIEWRDRGANSSRNHINIQCCWCGRNDPSFHLSIDEDDGAYYCLRNGKAHSGRSTPWLLLGLGVHPSEIDSLVDEFSDRDSKPKLAEAPKQKFDWNKFEPAESSRLCVEYLRSRGYEHPEGVCEYQSLRFTKTGKFAWRLLLPLTIGTNVTGFSGRALRASQAPRYLTYDEFGGSVFSPSRIVYPTLLLCEGPFDALAADASLLPISAIAILGTQLPAERCLHIASIASQTKRIAYVPDKDQSYSSTYRLIEELEGTPGIRKVELVALPDGYKDIAEYWEKNREGAKQWLATAVM